MRVEPPDEDLDSGSFWVVFKQKKNQKTSKVVEIKEHEGEIRRGYREGETTIFQHKKWGWWNRGLWYFPGHTPINQPLQPETHFGFKQLFAPYDGASRRYVWHHNAELMRSQTSNRRRWNYPLPPSSPFCPNPRPFGFIKARTGGSTEKWAQVNLTVRWTRSGYSARGRDLWNTALFLNTVHTLEQTCS